MRSAAVGGPAPRGAGGPLGLTRGAVAAIATLAATGIGASLMPPLLSLNLAAEGVSERMIGLLIATIAISALAITPLASPLAARIGTARLIAASVFAAAVLFPSVWFVDQVALLFPLLFVYGTALALCFTLSEYWINAATPEHRRGLVMGIYATVLSVGFAVGPGIIAVLGFASVRPFLLGAAIIAAAAIPALAAQSVSPDFKEAPRRRFAAFIFAVPVATLGVFVFAMGEQSGFGFLPLWGSHLGFDPSLAVLLAAAMTLGNVVFQIPIGLVADRFDRRLVLLACGLVGSLGMAAAWAVSGSAFLLMLVLLIWGGASAGIYTVGLAHLASRFSAGDLASANAAFVFCYALGMLVGPITVGDAMARAPTFGLPLVLGGAFAVYSLVVAIRIASSSVKAVAK
jgi:MFS family permease